MNYYELVGFDAGGSLPCSQHPTPPVLATSLLMLDFDGTLVEIGATPDGIHIPPDVPELLERLHAATGGATAIVSGRRLSDIDHFLPDFAGTVIGTHGAESREGKRIWRHGFSGSDTIRQLREVLRAWVGDAPGILVEENPASVVLHFRQAPEHMEAGEKFLSVLAEQTDGYVLHRAKMAFELHPEDVSKKSAAEHLMHRYPGRSPIAIGDDTTDEGMIDAAQANGGFGVKVGDSHSQALYRVGDPAAVRALLSDWLDAEDVSR